MAQLKNSRTTVSSEVGYAAIDKIAGLKAQGRKYFFLEHTGIDADAHVSLGIFLARKGYNHFRMKVGLGPKSVWLCDPADREYDTAEARKELLPGR